MTDSKAKEAGENSLKYIIEHNRAAWLDLFDDNAVIVDPAGKSYIDPAGNGHKGRSQLESFFDHYVAPSNFTVELKSSIPSGNECASQLLITYRLNNGKTETMNIIVVYSVNSQSLIDSIKVYWRFDALMKSIADS